MLAFALAIFGAGLGATGCTMNVQAVSVEKSMKRPLMSGFHGFYSLGGIVGATVLTVCMTSGLSDLHATIFGNICGVDTWLSGSVSKAC